MSLYRTVRHETIDAERPQKDAIERAAAIVRGGGVVAYPTETFYALGASAENEGARERLFALKGREAQKLLPVIVADVDALARLAALSARALSLAERFWPGPLSLVLPRKSGRGTIAVRVSGCRAARELAAAAGPLTATSANRSGEPPATTAAAVEAVFGDALDLVLDGGPTPGGLPSTLVDLTSDEPVLLRKGAVDFQEVLTWLARPS